MENGKEAPLQRRLEIDEQVPAADEIELAERRILEHIVLGKDDHLPDIMPDHILVALPRKVPGQAVQADVLYDVVPVNTAVRLHDRVGIEVCREDLHIPPHAQLFHDLREEDRDRVGLLTGRTAGHPDADLIALPCIFHQVRDDPFFQDLKVVRVSEK